jgi:hypothetical protein
MGSRLSQPVIAGLLIHHCQQNVTAHALS